MDKTRKTLQHVTWVSAQEALLPGHGAVSPLLTKYGFSHGFLGKGSSAENFHYPHQTHSTEIIVAASNTAHLSPVRPEADGIFTAQKGILLAVKTADCLPIISVSHDYALALHAGWRGLFAGIITHGVEYITAGGIKLAKSRWAIGPAISLTNYEVSDELVDTMCNSALDLNSSQLSLCLAKGNAASKWFLDLQTAAAFALLNIGVPPQNISIIRICTYATPELFHSYRLQKSHTGANWSFVGLS